MSKYTVIKLSLRQIERSRAFGMLAARTSVIRVAKLSGCSRFIVQSLVRRYRKTGLSIDAPRSGDVSQRHRDTTFNLLSRIYASGSSRQLQFPDVSKVQAR